MKSLWLVAIIVFGLLPGVASAKTFAQKNKSERSTWTVQLENDRFSNTDRHYTHGTRV